MTAPARQLELRKGSSTLSLNDHTNYTLQAANGWRSEGNVLQIRIGITTATTLAQLDRTISPLYQWLTAAEVYEQNLSGDAVYVYTKTCDPLSTVAEIGATWMRKRIHGGTITVEHVTGAAAVPVALVTLRFDVDELWQRAAAESLLEVTTGSANIATRSDGGITSSGVAEIYARRTTFTTSTGITARYFWVYADSGTAQVNFLRVSGDMRCFWGGLGKTFGIGDHAGNYYYSAAKTYTAGQVLEVVCRWTTSKMTIYVNGSKLKEQSGTFTLTAPDTYRVYGPDASSGTQSILSIQVWPTALTDAEIEAMVAYGRPAAELAYTVPPSDDKATNAVYTLYNMPGEAPAPLRAVLASSGSSDFSQVRMALRPYRSPTVRWECESGTLGTSVASNSNSDASGGSQARFTPADTAYATRVTLTLASNPSDVAALQGDYRIFLAGYDSAASVQVNKLKWRLVVAGVAGDYSDELSFAAVSTRSLLDLGTVSIPHGAWPEETLAAATTGYGSAFITLEIAAKNTTGSGGGTLDIDAVYLAPAEQEGVLTGTIDVSDVSGMVGWINDPPTALTVQDNRSMEFGGWLAWVGDDLAVPPIAGTAGKLWAFWYRNSVEQAFPNDTCDVQLYYAPRWR